jgi:hypothetical protein
VIVVRTNGEVIREVRGGPDPLEIALSSLRRDLTLDLHARLDRWCLELGWNDCRWRNF